MNSTRSILTKNNYKLPESELALKYISVDFNSATVSEIENYKLVLDDVYHGKNQNFNDVFNDISNLYNVHKLENLKQRTANPTTKKYDDIRGSTRKIRKQKGTGFARQGRIRSPLHKGGVITFGPNNRQFDFKINKKCYKLAMFTALVHKFSKNLIVIAKFIDSDKCNKTTHIAKVIDAVKLYLSLSPKKIDVVVDSNNEAVALQFIKVASNIEGVRVIQSHKLRVMDLMNNNLLILLDVAFDSMKIKAMKP